MKIWIVSKKRFPSCELSAMRLGIILSPHSMRNMKDKFLKSCSGCKCKESKVNLLTQVVEEWVLMTPPCSRGWRRVRLLQWVTACLSIAAVQKFVHVLELPRHPHKVSDVPMEEPEWRERDTTPQQKKDETTGVRSLA